MADDRREGEPGEPRPRKDDRVRFPFGHSIDGSLEDYLKSSQMDPDASDALGPAFESEPGATPLPLLGKKHGANPDEVLVDDSDEVVSPFAKKGGAAPPPPKKPSGRAPAPKKEEDDSSVEISSPLSRPKPASPTGHHKRPTQRTGDESSDIKSPLPARGAAPPAQAARGAAPKKPFDPSDSLDSPVLMNSRESELGSDEYVIGDSDEDDVDFPASGEELLVPPGMPARGAGPRSPTPTQGAQRPGPPPATPSRGMQRPGPVPATPTRGMQRPMGPGPGATPSQGMPRPGANDPFASAKQTLPPNYPQPGHTPAQGMPRPGGDPFGSGRGATLPPAYPQPGQTPAQGMPRPGGDPFGSGRGATMPPQYPVKGQTPAQGMPRPGGDPFGSGRGATLPPAYPQPGQTPAQGMPRPGADPFGSAKGATLPPQYPARGQTPAQGMPRPGGDPFGSGRGATLPPAYPQPGQTPAQGMPRPGQTPAQQPLPGGDPFGSAKGATLPPQYPARGQTPAQGLPRPGGDPFGSAKGATLPPQYPARGQTPAQGMPRPGGDPFGSGRGATLPPTYPQQPQGGPQHTLPPNYPQPSALAGRAPASDPFATGKGATLPPSYPTDDGTPESQRTLPPSYPQPAALQGRQQARPTEGRGPTPLPSGTPRDQVEAAHSGSPPLGSGVGSPGVGRSSIDPRMKQTVAPQYAPALDQPTPGRDEPSSEGPVDALRNLLPTSGERKRSDEFEPMAASFKPTDKARGAVYNVELSDDGAIDVKSDMGPLDAPTPRGSSRKGPDADVPSDVLRTRPEELDEFGELANTGSDAGSVTAPPPATRPPSARGAPQPAARGGPPPAPRPSGSQGGKASRLEKYLSGPRPALPPLQPLHSEFGEWMAEESAEWNAAAILKNLSKLSSAGVIRPSEIGTLDLEDSDEGANLRRTMELPALARGATTPGSLFASDEVTPLVMKPGSGSERARGGAAVLAPGSSESGLGSESGSGIASAVGSDVSGTGSAVGSDPGADILASDEGEISGEGAVTGVAEAEAQPEEGARLEAFFARIIDLWEGDALWILLSVGGALLGPLFIVFAGDYYQLPPRDRPLHHLHDQLKPGGTYGLVFGITASGLFLANLTYVLRRRFGFMKGLIGLRLWLNIHFLCGLVGGSLVLAHSALLANNVVALVCSAAIAVAVASGVFGRYVLYHLPRYLDEEEDDAQTSRERELDERKLAAQRVKELTRQIRIALNDQPRLRDAALAAVAAPQDESPRGILFALPMLVGDFRAMLKNRALAAELKVLLRDTQHKHARGIIKDTLRLLRNQSRLERRLAEAEAVRDLMDTWRGIHFILALVVVVTMILHVYLARFAVM